LPFLIVGSPSATVNPGASTSFVIRFVPPDAGLFNMSLAIANDDVDENPFDIALRGQGLVPGADSDGDGMPDAAEWELSKFGFNWQLSQPEDVALYYRSAPAAGLYTAVQLQALKVGTPLVAVDPVTRNFIVRVGLEASDDLVNFHHLPLTPAQLHITPEGKLDMEIPRNGDKHFLRLEVK
jgi:hypothetical protein